MKRLILISAACLVAAASSARTVDTDCSLFWKKDKVQVSELSYPQVTGYRQVGHHGPAVENSHMMVRIYTNGKGGIDIYSKTGKRGPELRQYLWYPTQEQQDKEGAGNDEYFVGNTVGLGGIWLWDGQKAVYPMPTGDCTAKVGKTAKGAWMEVIYRGVEYKGGKVDILMRVDTYNANRRAKVTARELNGKKVQFITGVNYHKGAETVMGNNYMATWGVHPADVAKAPGQIGGGMWFSPGKFSKVEKTETTLQITSKPTDRISTWIVSASLKEDELNSAEKFFKYVKDGK